MLPRCLVSLASSTLKGATEIFIVENKKILGEQDLSQTGRTS